MPSFTRQGGAGAAERHLLRAGAAVAVEPRDAVAVVGLRPDSRKSRGVLTQDYPAV